MDSQSSAAALAEAISESLNGLALLAFPRVLQRIREQDEPVAFFEGLRSSLEHVLQLLREQSSSFTGPLNPQEVIAEVEILLALLPSWSPADPAPEQLLAAARRCLALFGCQEPPEGWDSFEPPR